MIGRIIHLFRDETRSNVGSDDPTTDVRHIPVSLFYPGQPVSPHMGTQRQPSYADLFAPATGPALELLAGMGVDPNYLKCLETGIYENAVASEAGKIYPVVLFSPAFGVVRDMYTFLITELVNRGYAVVSIGSPYESIFSVLPDGTLVRQSDIVSRIHNTDLDLWDTLLEQRVRDLLFVLNQLAVWDNPALPLTFDLSAVAVAGHSLGGAGAYEALRRDARLRTGILLDPSFHLIRGKHREPVEAPLLILREQNTTSSSLKDHMADEEALPLVEGVKRLADSHSGFLSMVKILGADHMTFSDVPLHFRNPDVKEIHLVINRLAGSFLDQFLKGVDGSFSDMVSQESGERFVPTDRVGHPSN